MNAVSRGMHRAPDGIQRALEDYPRGFRRLEMWAENAIQLYKETQLAFLPGSPVRGPGEWRCSGTCDELAQGCSVAAAPGPARRPGGGPGLLTSSSHRRRWVTSRGHFCPPCPVGALAPPMRPLSTHLLLLTCHRYLGGWPLLTPSHCSPGDTFQLMMGSRALGAAGSSFRVVWADCFAPWASVSSSVKRTDFQ